MKQDNKRRSFLKNITLGGIGAAITPNEILKANPGMEDGILSQNRNENRIPSAKRKYNDSYKLENLKHVAFPIGGLGAGMFCLEGAGAISHMSVRNRPEIFNEPGMFAAIAVKGFQNAVKLIEGPVPDWKFFGQPGTGNGAAGTTYGLPRFRNAEFTARFPSCTVKLDDSDMPLRVHIKGWSPFIPTDEDNSSLPFGALEYQFSNPGAKKIDAVFSFNTRNFLATDQEAENSITEIKNGFVLKQIGTQEKPFLQFASPFSQLKRIPWLIIAGFAAAGGIRLPWHGMP